MEDKDKELLLTEIANLKVRLQILEAKVFPTTFTPTHSPLPPEVPKAARVREERKPSNVLGYVGASCLLFAIVLLIKFSIDSGWLTPVRQMVIASLFGLSLIFATFVKKFEDRSYIAILPAAGLAVLHLTIYGSVFYHSLLSPFSGLICTSLVGALSLFLLSRFREETYAVMASAGTYLGAVLLKDSFASLEYFALYLLLWNIIFATSAIKLKIRSIIVLCAYFSLFLVATISLGGQSDLKWSVVILQTAQMIIYSWATYFYTVENKTKLTSTEATRFLPVYLFFYGHVFYILDKINPYYATAFAIIFSASLLALLKVAKNKINNESMDSAPIIYLFIAIVLSHSLFFVAMNDISQYITVAVLLALATFVRKHPERSEFSGVKFVLGLVVVYGILNLSFSPGILANWILAGFGIIYGVLALFNFGSNKKDKPMVLEAMLVIAHSQMIIAVYRLKEYIGEYGVPPVWIIYAFGILYFGMKQQNAKLAKSVFPVIFIAIVYFLFNTFSVLDQGQRILSLLIMGGLIYISGYFYRKITMDAST
jgi:uncharacterized membrane protein